MGSQLRKLLAFLLAVAVGSAQGQMLQAITNSKGTAASSNNIVFINAVGCYLDGSETTITCTTAFSPSNGHSLIVWAFHGGASNAITCNDAEGTGNVYTSDISSASGTTLVGQLFHASNISGSGTYAVSCTTSPSAGPIFWGMNFAEYSGVLNASPTDGTGVSATNTTANPNPGAITTTNANDILISAFANTTGSSATLTIGNGYTSRTQANDGSTSFVGGLADKIVTSTCATCSDGWTYSISGDTWVAVHFAYKSQ